ncbi:MAG: iron ABC transporter permease [Lentisphaerae bacterium]|nr:iron ABC transporter permease [Lentisphaerota bacterium]MCP4103305.1 iron ABC transporter permease [Lentisphaerota bacterium]
MENKSRKSFGTFRERSSFRVIVFIVLTLFAVTAFFISLRVGTLKLGWSGIAKALFIEDSGINRQIIWNIRMPRNIVAILVGISLSLSGAILQGIMRNPLASPNIIGVSAGGGLMAILIMIVFPQYIALLVPAAFAGAVGTTLLIYLVAWKHGVQPMRLVLAGVAVASLLGACISALMQFYPDRVAGVVSFMVGGLSARTWRHVYLIWPYSIVGMILALAGAKRLNILGLGDEIAVSLGINVELTRAVLIAVSSMLAAAAVSVAGLLGFVGLIVPHTMRMIVGYDYRVLLPACILFSSGLMLLCDTAGRVVIEPAELPVGIIMALLGAPFFLYLLRGKKHENRST